MRLFLLALVAAPAVTYFIYRLARGLGFLDPPVSKEHEYRRTVSAALYAFLLFLPIFFYGYEKGWPRVWRIFAVVNGVVLLFFAVIGTGTAVRLWRLRHPEDLPAPPEAVRAAAESGLPGVEIRQAPPENPS